VNSKLIIQLAFLLVLAAAVNWYLDTIVEEPGQKIIQANDPDLYMSNASLTQFDERGAIRHRIEASKFTHYPATDITTLMMPIITLYKKSGPPWHIKSQAGRILPGLAEKDRILELWDSVLIERTRSENEFITIRSENLTVLPEQDYAETDQTVIIDDNTGRTVASGMKAYLTPGHFIFYSTEQQRVSTVILPKGNQS
jgi:lipopolysaccharide export system protein LptC